MEILKPQSLNSYFQASIEMEVAGESTVIDGVDMLPIKAVVRGGNSSHKKLKIASGYLEVYADKIRASPEEDFSAANVEVALNHVKAARSRYANNIDTQLIFVATVFADWSFEPGEQQTFYRMFRVPKNTFDQLEANIYILSGPDVEWLDITHKVDPSYKIKYSLSIKNDSKKMEYSRESDEGQKLLSKAGFADSTFYLVLPHAKPKPELVAPAKSPVLQ